MKIGWKHIVGWLFATAAISFIIIGLGGWLAQAGIQVLGISVPTEWNLMAIIAVILMSAWQGAILVLVVSVFALVFKRMAKIDSEFDN